MLWKELGHLDVSYAAVTAIATTRNLIVFFLVCSSVLNETPHISHLQYIEAMSKACEAPCLGAVRSSQPSSGNSSKVARPA